MVEINRVWLNVDTDTNKITLFSRPRVSIRVDEYIWSLIEEHIVKPHKLMRSEKHKYLLKIAFGRFDLVRHRYYPLSPYNGQLREGVKPDSANGWYPREDFADSEERTIWFSPDKIWTNCGNKVLDVNIDAANVSESITPRECRGFIKQYLQKLPQWGRFGVTSVTPFLLLPVHPEGYTPAHHT